MNLSRFLLDSRSVPDPPGYDESIQPPERKDLTVRHEDREYQCHVVNSSNGSWRVAYGRSETGESSRMFVFSEESLTYSVPTDRPVDAAIANDGSVIMLEGGASGRLDGNIQVFDSLGELLLEHHLPVNPQNCVISADGQLGGVVTRPPDLSVRLFDTADGTLLATQEIDDDPVRLLGFTSGRNKELLYVAQVDRDDPYFAIDSEGTIAWQSERYRDTEKLTERVRNWIDSFGRPDST